MTGSQFSKVDLPTIAGIEPEAINNKVIKAALQRIKDRSATNASSSDYYTKHTSHSTYSKGW